MENMELYNSFRSVPDNAKKNITGGRLRGMTDINPMWRIQQLTERFGPCGVGWKYTIRDKHLERGPNDEIAAVVDIDLFYKADGAWSEAVPGTGGSMFVAREKSGLYVSDECYKMALTDALSVACKALGMGSDVYWAAGRTKYDTPIRCADCGSVIRPAKRKDGSRWLVPDIVKYCDKMFGRPLCDKCISRAAKEADDRAAG